MNPLKRHSVSKHKSVKQFRSHSSHTMGANLAPPPMRGGYRL